MELFKSIIKFANKLSKKINFERLIGSLRGVDKSLKQVVLYQR